MKSYQIKDIKKFMSQFLGGDAFKDFLLAEAVITTYNTFVIDGHMVKDFFTGDISDEGILPPYEFSKWKDMRPLCFDLIKGKRTPVNFKFVLHFKPELIEKILSENDTRLSLHDIKSFVLNIKYDGSVLTCITATAFYTFLPDKTPDKLWDDYMTHFLDILEIPYET